MEAPPAHDGPGAERTGPGDPHSRTTVIYYVLAKESWANSAVWGARAIFALALHYLYPWVDLIYSDSDCGPGCADVIRNMVTFSRREDEQVAGGDPPRSSRVPVAYADVAAPVNTGCFLLPRDPEHESRGARCSPDEGSALEYSEAQFVRLLKERAPFLLGEDLLPVHLLQCWADQVKRDAFRGTALADAWVEDRATFLVAWNIAIGNGLPFFRHTIGKPGAAKAYIPYTSEVQLREPPYSISATAAQRFGGMLYEQQPFMVVWDGLRLPHLHRCVVLPGAGLMVQGCEQGAFAVDPLRWDPSKDPPLPLPSVSVKDIEAQFQRADMAENLEELRRRAKSGASARLATVSVRLLEGLAFPPGHPLVKALHLDDGLATWARWQTGY